MKRKSLQILSLLIVLLLIVGMNSGIILAQEGGAVPAGVYGTLYGMSFCFGGNTYVLYNPNGAVLSLTCVFQNILGATTYAPPTLYSAPGARGVGTRYNVPPSTFAVFSAHEVVGTGYVVFTTKSNA